MKETKIEKFILDLSSRWDCSPQEAVDRLNSMNESEINKLINSMTNKFKNGGMIDCLRAGGKTYAECKKCGGRTPIIKNQEPAGPLRSRGTAPASSGIFQPNMDNRDALWVRNNGADVRNHFTGNDLTQYFITPGFYGTPRLQQRIISNYNTPAASDTVYVDGNGVRSGHSQKYIDSVNRILSGAEPYATSGKEVRDMKKRK